MRYFPVRLNPGVLRLNPGIPQQTDVINSILKALAGKTGNNTALIVPYMEDLYFRADGSYPAIIEEGILKLEDLGIEPKFPIRVTVTKAKGPTSLDILPIDVPLKYFPYVAHIQISNWGKPEAMDALDHELVHVVQWIGTGLIRLMQGSSVMDAFEQRPGEILYGAPKKKYRTYQEVPEVPPTDVRERLGLELSLDPEFMAYGRTFATQIAPKLPADASKEEIHRAVEAYFDDLLETSLRRVPGSEKRWEGQKKLVRRLLEQQMIR